MIIYKIENKINAKVYIGQSVGTVSRRWGQHVSAAKNKYSNGCTKLYRAIRKYGCEGFTQEVLFESDDQNEIDTKEIELILKYNAIENGYNLQLGGKLSGGHSQETRDKMSKTRKGKKPYELTDATKKKMSESLKGRPYHNNLSEEGRKSISEKASARLKGKRLSESAYTSGTNAKTYDIKHPDGGVEVVKNLRNFSRVHELNYDCMIQIVRGKQKTHKGYQIVREGGDFGSIVNHKSKTFEVTDPAGVIHTIENLSDFSRNNGLHESRLRHRVEDGKRVNGWAARIISDG